MSIFNKNFLSNFFGLSSDEEDYYEEDGHNEYNQQEKINTQFNSVENHTRKEGQPPLTERPSARYRTTEKEEPTDRPTSEKKVVSMHATPGSLGNKHLRESSMTKSSNKISIIEPRIYSEAMNIAKHVLAQEAVLVNFNLIEEYQARRIVDFLTGIVYAVDGDIQRVGNEIFLCTPSTVEIDSATAQSLANKQLFDF
ncbi:cell division protein SepF [Melissococcus plutonius]|uniref:Cell division protein SepF n=1 Tax=Melissococcus plutonius TaxID=33970 RepID=A0A2Z5Y3E7_9ENTE|nr:cell division protein SepF [Melissococcus plutonius]BAL62379.1 FtsZ-interacting protein related to cell division [Melissococcus plutonius DAT561]MCV2498148.1 cell division protein SepF [Melissococcus plutonius]MCV2500931.1 cell division protein SepF [Melissococcus plutonius]MCV2504300.1 cell division protein SepF [Melissococcus plutonius]MCV2506763.1 cell division protein SepF [Melissococcus plutonius]